MSVTCALRNLVLALAISISCFSLSWADPIPIPIAAGSLTLQSGEIVVRVHLEGPRGLTLDGTGHRSGLRVDASCIGTPECAPGETVQINGDWDSSFFGGRATLDGRSYPIGIGSDEQGVARVIFDGLFVVPEFTDSARTTVATPFTFTGFILPPRLPGMNVGPAVPMFGGGMAEIDLVLLPFNLGGWSFDAARLEFETVDPVPEPATLLLVGSGIGLIVRCRARARGRAR